MERMRPEFMAWRARIDPDDEDDEALAARFLADLPTADAALLGERGAEFVAGVAWEALRQPEGYLRDAALLFREWDFPVAGVACPRRCGSAGSTRRRSRPRAVVDRAAAGRRGSTSLPGTTHLADPAHPVAGDPAELSQAANRDGLTARRRRRASGGLLVRRRPAPAAAPRCAPARGTSPRPGAGRSRAVARRHDQARVARPARRSRSPAARGSTIAAASAARSVASMPCSPATARSRARCASYAARSASWSTASARQHVRLAVLQRRVGVRLVPRRPARPSCGSARPSGSRGEVGVEVAGELVVQHRQLVGLRQRRHLDDASRRGRAAPAGRREDLAVARVAGPRARAAPRAGRRRSAPAASALGVVARRPARRAGPPRRRRCGTSARRSPGCVAIGRMPAPGTRPSVGLSPTRLCASRGQRIEPSVSVPTVTVASPSAAAAPEPLLEPLGVRLTSYGLSTWPPSDE